MKYIIWNAYKADDAETYEALLKVELRDDCSWSSEIKVDNEAHLKAILEAVHNETDVDLKYHRLNESTFEWFKRLWFRIRF
jgi:hypothetical protein